jgi:hypothetical protein
MQEGNGVLFQTSLVSGQSYGSAEENHEYLNQN